VTATDVPHGAPRESAAGPSPRLFFAIAWCGLVATAGTVLGIALIAWAVQDSAGQALSPFAAALISTVVTLGALLLGPAVALWVATVQLWRKPPAGRWLAGVALSLYAAGVLVLPVGDLLSTGTLRPFSQMLALVGAAFLGSAVLVAWAARTGRSAPQGL